VTGNKNVFNAINNLLTVGCQSHAFSANLLQILAHFGGLGPGQKTKKNRTKPIPLEPSALSTLNAIVLFSLLGTDVHSVTKKTVQS